LSLGVTLAKSANLSLRLGYEGELRKDYHSHTGMLSLRSTF
jgi:uncharacterized protein with beta-barrel porin domain